MAHLRCASSVASGACSAVGVVDATEIPILPADRPAHSSAVSFTGRLSNAGRRALAHVVSSESGRRVGGDVASPTPHRTGRADF